MNAVIVSDASVEEIAALVLAVQKQQKICLEGEKTENEREAMIRYYERYLSELKAGELPKDEKISESERQTVICECEFRLAKLKAGASP